MGIVSGPIAADLEAGPARTEGARPKQGYLPSLDGWRAIAIFAVIQFHDGFYRFGPFSNRWLHEWGYQGVDLFFAISGFLICSRLLDEERKNGVISLRGFYIRRSFRIMPAAWLYLGVYAVLSLANVLPRDWGGVVTSFSMVRNLWIAHAGDTPSRWYTIHFWSLSVEEHFYLLLPALLVFVVRRRLFITGTIAALATLWTLIIQRYPSLQSEAVWLRTDDRLSQLMVPAFFAILLADQRVRDAVLRWLRPWVAFAFIAVVMLIAPHIRTAGLLATIIGFPLLVISTVFHPSSWTSRALELPPLKFVGRISYSLYLWQELFFVLGHQRATGLLSVLQYAPWSYLATFTMALLSYQFVERPLIRIGHRIASRRES
jgi:peptidoglycan/LPS O-acetylase OafA/YrhL